MITYAKVTTKHYEKVNNDSKKTLSFERRVVSRKALHVRLNQELQFF